MIATCGHQRQIKRSMLEQQFALCVDQVVGSDHREFGYRWSAKRVVSGKPGAVVLGSYLPGSHQVVDMSECLIEHPDITKAARELAHAASELTLEPYDESSTTGDLRYVWFKTDGRGQVLVCLFTRCSQSRAAAELPARLSATAGISHGLQPDQGNVIRGKKLRDLRGISRLSFELAGQRIQVGPLGFLQPNPPVAERAYRDLMRTATGSDCRGQVALDLYAGAGVTTGLLKQRYSQVIASESDGESASLLGIEPTTVQQLLDELLTARSSGRPEPAQLDFAVANPPRAGLGAGICRQLNALRLPALHVMSCNPASMARDLSELTGPQGAYRLAGARAYDTLPHTPHLELVVWLEAALPTATV